MFIMHVIPVAIYTDGGGINEFNWMLTYSACGNSHLLVKVHLN